VAIHTVIYKAIKRNLLDEAKCQGIHSSLNSKSTIYHNMSQLECVYEFVVDTLSLVKWTYLQEVCFMFLLSHFPAGAYTW